MTDAGTGSALTEFTDCAVLWDSLVAEHAKGANRIFDRLHVLAKFLREQPTGRSGLIALTTHKVIGVRLLAATECLAWDPETAVPVLEEIERMKGLHSVSAKYTLKSHKEGVLDLNW